MIFKYLLIFKISLFLSLANAEGRHVPCPVVSPAQGVFSAAQIKKGALVAVEAGDDEYPVNLVLYKSENGLCREELVAKYSIEGAAPQVDSLFFGRIKGRVNLFVIVRWELRHSGMGTYGDLYQVYSYESDSSGSLSENKSIVENSEMTGVEGYVEHQVSTFRLKTALDVKNFIRRMR
ncbi:peptidase associated/transthyretin-like domain-containing protein [Cupriavidus sp. PET2-C1]